LKENIVQGMCGYRRVQVIAIQVSVLYSICVITRKVSEQELSRNDRMMQKYSRQKNARDLVWRNKSM
jgi:hypothetical protein